jgi:hypothetical protein
LSSNVTPGAVLMSVVSILVDILRRDKKEEIFDGFGGRQLRNGATRRRKVMTSIISNEPLLDQCEATDLSKYTQHRRINVLQWFQCAKIIGRRNYIS